MLRVDSPARLQAQAADPILVADLGSTPDADLVAAVRDRPFVHDVSVEDRRIRVRVADPEIATPELARELVRRGAAILGLRAETASLESVYFDVMGIEPTTSGALA
jgi:hypothetical protein